MSKIIEVLGMSQGCPGCDTLKKKLDYAGHSYAFYDVHTSKAERMTEMKKELFALGKRQVPAMWVDGEFVGSGLEEISIV